MDFFRAVSKDSLNGVDRAFGGSRVDRNVFRDVDVVGRRNFAFWIPVEFRREWRGVVDAGENAEPENDTGVDAFPGMEVEPVEPVELVKNSGSPERL